MWADREEMSPMDTQNVAGNYNESGSFPTASSIHNYPETPLFLQAHAAHSCRNHAWSENILEWSSCACAQNDFHLKYLCPIMGHLASLH